MPLKYPIGNLLLPDFTSSRRGYFGIFALNLSIELCMECLNSLSNNLLKIRVRRLKIQISPSEMGGFLMHITGVKRKNVMGN